ncbi:hypothetical protein CDAR_424721 [Caerostris darwini]|uniref:Uncharacterized protein n=1 Tax=Caerostris darwini TaxID=1538125 RepID=A0AAV4RSM0_9ARAC|nr:hypothetical protein CDAR_424721 [Caerostris darwini]
MQTFLNASYFEPEGMGHQEVLCGVGKPGFGPRFLIISTYNPCSSETSKMTSSLKFIKARKDSSELYKADFEFSRTPTSQSSATKQRDAVEIDDVPPVKESFSSTRSSPPKPEVKSRALSRFRERNVAPKRKPQLNLRKRISHQDQLNSRNKESNDTPKKVTSDLSAEINIGKVTYNSTRIGKNQNTKLLQRDLEKKEATKKF